MRSHFFIILALSSILVSCASMFGEKSDPVSIESEPSGADVYFRNQYLGKTPLQTKLARYPEAPTLTLKKPGYEDHKVFLGRAIDGVAFFNFGFITTTSGATSWGVDAVSGKMWKVNQNSYVVRLERVGKAYLDAGERMMDFVLVHTEGLRNEISRGFGEKFESLCSQIKLTELQCHEFYSVARAHKEVLLSRKDSLEFYRSLRPLLNDQQLVVGR